MAEEKILTLGIAGGTGSGKSSIVEKLLESFPGEVSLMSLDNYYKEHHSLSYEERTKLNYDSPDSFDIDLFVEHVKKLQNWESIKSPIYDYTVHDRTEKVSEIAPNRLLIVDGIFTLVFPELVALMDTKIFVDVDADVRILRRVKRDMEMRGRSLDSVIDQYLTTVKPMHEKYIEPSKAKADLIIPQGAFNKVAINILLDHIRGVLNGEKEI